MGRLADIADHFRRRSIALGQSGYFGGHFTHHRRLRGVYSGLASLIDNPNLSFLLEGAKGTGKSSLAHEFVRLENISRRLLGLEASRFVKVDARSRYDILHGLYKKDVQLTPALYYLPHLENFQLNEQELLNRLLARQDYREQNYRLVVSCEESLAFLVQRGKIISDLVERLRHRCFHLPRLNDRSDDFPDLISSLCHRYSGKKDLPTQALLDYLMTLNYPYNLDSLSLLLKEGLIHKPHLASWTPKFIEEIYPLARVSTNQNVLDLRQRIRYS